ncbi:MAG: DUF6377 domain-containing protein [Flavisolibacter sp.]
MRYMLALLIFFSTQAKTQLHFPDLDRAIANSGQFDRQKEKDILGLKSQLKNAEGYRLFEGYEKLYEAYKVFNYDSAYAYAQKQLGLAKQLRDKELLDCSRLKLGFVLLSAGLFKEAIDTLQVIAAANLSENRRTEYYTLLARYYYDLADYTMDRYYSPQYNSIGDRYLDSAVLYQKSDFDLLYYKGLKNIRSGKIGIASTYLKKLIAEPGLSLHQEALATSTMSDIYIQEGKEDSAIQLLTRAAIADIQSSTKETSAIFNLSNLLFKKGDLKDASTYIEKAVKDAMSYGARQRKVQMSAILPLIEGEKVARVEHEKKTVTTYAIIVTLLLLLLAYLIVVITQQIKKLKIAQNALVGANEEQQKMNAKLVETNKIKEEYIGFFFNTTTAFYNKVERFKRKAEQKILDRKPEEMLFLVRNLNVQQEQEELLKNFDTIFLKIFPHFIEKYNALFSEGDRTQLKEGEGLTTGLRIFALIRLGIHDNDKIAAILCYSVNTINTYKTKIKNRSLVSNEQFEDKIMEIKSV